ncbi:hypothetical protein D9M70_449120 [compost metagenome]
MLEGLEIADADVEVAVGGQQDAVDAVRDEALLRLLVGELDARLAGRRAAGAEPVDGGADLRLVAAGGGLEHHPRLAGVDHQGHLVLGAQLVDQQLQRALHQRQALGAVHRAGHVDQEHQVGRRQLV